MTIQTTKSHRPAAGELLTNTGGDYSRPLAKFVEMLRKTASAGRTHTTAKNAELVKEHRDEHHRRAFFLQMRTNRRRSEGSLGVQSAGTNSTGSSAEFAGLQAISRANTREWLMKEHATLLDDEVEDYLAAENVDPHLLYKHSCHHSLLALRARSAAKQLVHVFQAIAQASTIASMDASNASMKDNWDDEEGYYRESFLVL